MAASTPITVERLEQALDFIAEGMLVMGDEGSAYLPLFEKLERKLDEVRGNDDRMAAILARAKRSKDRKGGSPSP